MIKRLKALRYNMAFNITAVIVLLLAAFGIVVSVVGILKFSDALDAEYSNTTYHIADTAASLVNGDHIDEYLAGGRICQDEEDSQCLLQQDERFPGIRHQSRSE